jgi:hypothetical protein
VEETVNSVVEKRLGHAIPRYCLDKYWEIDGLDDVEIAKDGSLWCTVKWKATRLNAKALVGEAVENRLKDLFIQKYGVEEWEQQTSQSSSGRRRRPTKES